MSELRLRGVVCALLLVTPVAAQQPDAFREQLEVRETSVTALPPGAGAAPPAPAAVTLLVDGVEQPVTRVERVLAGERGDWRITVYLDPLLAGPRTRYRALLALAQRAEELSALGRVEVLYAEAPRPALEPTGQWQRIEAGLLREALAARRDLARGGAVVARPAPERFHQRLALLRGALAGRGDPAARVLFVPSDGLDAAFDRDALAAVGRELAGDGWIAFPLPWEEQPSEESTARLDEFERWRQGAEGRDVGAGGRRYVIDFGRVLRRLSGSMEAAPRPPAVPEPRLAALAAVADPTSGRLAGDDGELAAVLSELARRWRVWFQARTPRDGMLREVEVRLGERQLEAPGWLRSPVPEG